MKLTIEIKAENDLSPERKVALDQMFKREFGHHTLIYAYPRWHVMGILDGGLISRVGILKRTISVGQELLQVSGICGVVTAPEHRGRGIASALLGESVAFIKNRLNLPFALLTCRLKLEAFYERLGWKTAKGPTVFTQPDGVRTCAGLTMVTELGPRPWPEGPIDLRGLPW
ncbi:MAG: GNAT family N-acetyltransferase [Deltaproteobacteria bacterium]|nr:MAG: GNAT family N-acetyltransferase [Deltaproteobacteria bacterium]